MSGQAEDLLEALLIVYWNDGVTQATAAKLLGMRKESFAEFAELRLGEAALERVARRYYRLAFHRLFPECDANARLKGTLARTPPAKPCEWSDPTPAESRLVEPPQRRTLRELVPSPRLPDAEVAAYLQRYRVPLYKRFHDEPETGTENEVAEVKWS